MKNPSQASFSITRAQIFEFSPIPAVKTNVSSPPSAAATRAQTCPINEIIDRKRRVLHGSPAQSGQQVQ
jgi:hypothetical protein